MPCPNNSNSSSTGTEYASFDTYLYLPFHIVAFDIKALVPRHQFMYTLFIARGRLFIQRDHDSILQVLIICEALPAFLETGKSPTVPGPDCTE